MGLKGLQGAADTKGYEPDGLVTVEELGDYLDKQIPAEARKLGKTNEEKKQTRHLLESRGADFALTHNPAVTAKVAERLEKLSQLAKDDKISKEWAAEGQPLLERMPAGLQQLVGETGWQLSHGEKSRLYIARALLQGAQILILDESLAALDPQTLRRSLACVLERAPTILVIAHP